MRWPRGSIVSRDVPQLPLHCHHLAPFPAGGNNEPVPVPAVGKGQYSGVIRDHSVVVSCAALHRCLL